MLRFGAKTLVPRLSRVIAPSRTIFLSASTRTHPRRLVSPSLAPRTLTTASQLWSPFVRHKSDTKASVVSDDMYSSHSSGDESTSSSSSGSSSESDAFASANDDNVVAASRPKPGQADGVGAIVGNDNIVVNDDADGDDGHEVEGLELTVEQLAELGVPETGDEDGDRDDWWVSPDDVHDPRLKEKPVSKSWANLDPAVIGKPPSPQDVLEFIDKEKLENVWWAELGEQIPWTDHMIVATGITDNQIDRIAQGLFTLMRAREVPGMGPRVEGRGLHSGWVIVDLGNIVVHFMLEQQRSYYNIEEVYTGSCTNLHLLGSTSGPDSKRKRTAGRKKSAKKIQEEEEAALAQANEAIPEEKQVTPVPPPVPEGGKRKRGRPKGSKNKPKASH